MFKVVLLLQISQLEGLSVTVSLLRKKRVQKLSVIVLTISGQIKQELKSYW